MAFDAHAIWLLAQGESDGRPIYVRARDPRQVAVSPERGIVVVVSLSYSAGDGLQTPSSDEYAAIENFEASVFDNQEGDPELVCVETGAGVIRYFAYTSNADQTLAVIKEAAPFDILDLDSAEDPEWELYHRRVANLTSA